MKMSFYIDGVIFSAGGVLFDETSQEVFLVLKQKTGEWLLPKGRLEKGETIEETARREIFEETGYENSVKDFLSTQVREDIIDSSKHKIIFWFLSILKPGRQVSNTQMSDENFSGEWFGESEAIEILKFDEDKKLISLVFELAAKRDYGFREVFGIDEPLAP